MSQTKVKSGLLNFPDQTDFVKLPSGTTAQRPSSPEKGYSRYNTTDNKLEYWNGTIWQQLPSVLPPIITSISYPGDDLAADPDGGQTITINGGDFKAGATVTVDSTTPSVITFVSATEITFTAPAKTAGDYDIVVTNTDGGNATAVDGMTYNGLPSWTTPAGNLGTFPAGSTIPTITLVATEPDSGTVSYSVTTGALPSGLALSGADIDGTVPSPAGETTYNFSVTASDDENQESTERAFNIVVYLQVINTVSAADPFGDSSGVALYRFENNANDEGGVYNGTPTNVTYGTGLFGQASVFNGSNSKIQINGLSTFLGSSSSKSWSCWVKTTSTSGGNRAIISDYNTGVGNYNFDCYMVPTNGKVYLVSNAGGTGVYILSSATINNGAWHHICAVQNTTTNTLELYIDLNSQGTISIGTGTRTSPLFIGTYGVGYYWDGSIDQVRVFDRALEPLEVESLYRERTVVCGGQADTLDILGDNSCIATYQLNGNANDLSGNYSGTPTNVSYGVGEFDLAGVFNGSSSYIDTSLILNPNAGSVSMWVKTTATVGTFFGVNSNGDVNRFYLGVRDSNFWIGAGDIQVYTVSAADLIDGDWHHVALTLDGSTAKYYLDGNSTPVATTSYSSIGLQNTNPIIGGIRTAAGVVSGYYFNGSMDQVRIFNKALTPENVQTLYNESACDALACSGTTNTLNILGNGDTSCIAAYPLDGSPADLSGNYNGVQTDVTYPVGKYDLGAVANGTSTRINTGYIQNGQVFSVSFWGRNFSAYASLIRDTPAAGGANTRINIIANGAGGIALAGNYAVDPPTTLKTDWTHYVVTASGSVAKIYENTVEVASVSYSEAGGNNGTPVCMFSNGLYPVGFGKGELDQVRIFNKALSAGEVTTLYNETACN